MNGNYLGKNFSGIEGILNILEVPTEDRKMLFELLVIIDKHRSKALADAKPKTPSK